MPASNGRRRRPSEPIFRAPMRARTRDAAPGAGADFGIRRNVVGIGEVLTTVPSDAEEAVMSSAREHGQKAARLLRRFIELPSGSLVWTRQLDGAYRLGRIAGPWRYEQSRAAREVGIPHVRPTKWSPRCFGDRDTPAAVVKTFARGGRSFQQTHDREGEAETAALWLRYQPADRA